MQLLLLLATLADTTRVAVAPAETLHVTLHGTGQPVVLVPGLAGAAAAFRRLAEALAADGFRPVVVEPLGVGHSGRPDGADYSLTAQAARVAAALDSLALGPVVVAGHSLGGAIALRLGAARPDLVRAIVSIEGGPAESAATPGVRSAARMAPLIRLLGAGAVRGRVRKGLVASSGDPSWVTDSVVAAYTAGATRDLGATLRTFARIAESREPATLAPQLAAIRCPVVLLVGLAPHSEAVPAAEVERLRRGVAAFAVDSVAGAGHHVHEEQPLRVAAAIRAAHERGAVMALRSDP